MTNNLAFSISKSILLEPTLLLSPTLRDLAMYSSYYQEHDIFIKSIKKFCETELSPHLEQWEAEGFFPNEVFRKLGEQGFLGILIPEEYGGIGGDYKLAAAWCEAWGELCDVGLTVAINMHSLVIGHSVAKFGTDKVKNEWLPKVVSGEAIGAYAFTEPGAGSDLANLTTKAEKKGDKWVINGAKTFITNGARADFILVLTRTDPTAGYNGFTTFLVDTKTPGFSVSKKLDKLGWRSSDTAELSLENVEVDETCILGKLGEGWTQSSNNLNWERAMLTLTSLGGARACFRETAKYAGERKAFGKPLSELELIDSWLQEMYCRILEGEAICHHAIDLMSEGLDCRAEVSAAKRKVCEDAVWIADKAIQIHGGYGYTKEFNPEKWWRDLRLMPIGGGTSEIMGNIVAKHIGL
ncbi:MAG: acyl-CoA dehydrogenase family protein [Bdellovibrionota bacterium]